MILYNGSPMTLKSKAEGLLYIFGPKEQRRVENPLHRQVLLSNLSRAGLRELGQGQDFSDLDEECLQAFKDNAERCIQDFNDFKTEQERQGLKGVQPGPQLRNLADAYHEAGGDLKLTGYGNPVLVATGEVEEEPLPPEEQPPVSPGILRTRRAAQARQARKGKKGRGK